MLSTLLLHFRFLSIFGRDILGIPMRSANIRFTFGGREGFMAVDCY
jgi:hypothetical protein